jgi:hypothetical protein
MGAKPSVVVVSRDASGIVSEKTYEQGVYNFQPGMITPVHIIAAPRTEYNITGVVVGSADGSQQPGPFQESVMNPSRSQPMNVPMKPGLAWYLLTLQVLPYNGPETP